MRFVLDQSTDARLGDYLRAADHDVTRVGHEYPGGLPDDEVLTIACRERRILITDDRDFGELVFRLGLPHSGVIFLRLGAYSSLAEKIERVQYVLDRFAHNLDEFVVVGPHHVRVRPLQPPDRS